ncbi:hypothetical protein [Paenibacillus amylolyticus]|uniref:hypothetical protein n=1 Tax=Paenibacillus amylolyticus TaxID=1451 RepID=UPI003EBDD6BA
MAAINEISARINVDVSEALTGLKAIQREAKKATQALRELEEAQKAVSKCGLHTQITDTQTGVVVKDFGIDCGVLISTPTEDDFRRMSEIISNSRLNKEVAASE